jgi:hypothetical protein
LENLTGGGSQWWRAGVAARNGRNEKGLVGEQEPGPFTLDPARRRRKSRKNLSIAQVQEELPDPATAVAAGAAWIEAVVPGLLLRFDPIAVDLQSTEGNPLSHVRPLFDGRPSYSGGVRLLCNPVKVKVRQPFDSPGDSSPSRLVRPVPMDQFRGSDTVMLSRYGFAPHPKQTQGTGSDPYQAVLFPAFERTLACRDPQTKIRQSSLAIVHILPRKMTLSLSEKTSLSP